MAGIHRRRCGLFVGSSTSSWAARRDRYSLAANDRVDWWRVESIEHGRRLVLRAEMKASGRAYWLAVMPFHAVIFPVMVRNIIDAARRA